MDTRTKNTIMNKKLKKENASKLNIGDIIRIKEDDLKGTVYIVDNKNNIKKVLQNGMEVTSSTLKPNNPMVTMKEEDYLKRFSQIVAIEKDNKNKITFKFLDIKAIVKKPNDKISVVS